MRREEVFFDSGDGQGITESSHGGGLKSANNGNHLMLFLGREDSIQSNIGLFGSTRPLVKPAGSDSRQQRLRCHNSMPQTGGPASAIVDGFPFGWMGWTCI